LKVFEDLKSKYEDKDKELKLKDKDEDFTSEDKDKDLQIGPRGSSRTRTFLEDPITGAQTGDSVYDLAKCPSGPDGKQHLCFLLPLILK